jgi:signal transduction histidine kinase
VTDDGSPSREAGEAGELHGMRERVALYGGDLQTGPADAGGYAVRARLPLDLVHA